MIAVSALIHRVAVLEPSAIMASRTWFLRCVVERSSTEVSASSSPIFASTRSSTLLSSLFSVTRDRSPGIGIVGMAGDAEGEEPDEERKCLDIPDISASRMVERSAEMGGPGESARNIGGAIPGTSISYKKTL
jgi:hypothetical protein